jgi:hypothetical protein
MTKKTSKEKNDASAARPPEPVVDSEPQDEEPGSLDDAPDSEPEGIAQGQWTVGIFGSLCVDCISISLMSFFCPCISLANVTSRMGLHYFCVFVLAYGFLVLCMICGGVGVVPIFSDGTTSQQTAVRRNAFEYLYTHMYVNKQLESLQADYKAAKINVQTWQTQSYEIINDANNTVIPLVNQIMLSVAIASAVLQLQLLSSTRRNIRYLFDISGSFVADCLCSYFCSCCVISQLLAQTDSYANGSSNVEKSKGTLRAYPKQKS